MTAVVYENAKMYTIDPRASAAGIVVRVEQIVAVRDVAACRDAAAAQREDLPAMTVLPR